MPDTDRIATAFHQKAGEYDRHILVQKRVVVQLVQSIELHLAQSPGHILDVGTGTGGLLAKLQTRYPNARLTGIDVAHNMCERAQQKLGAACNIVNGDAACLPFNTGIFDLVVSASMLQWVEHVSAALFEMNRVVRPGGNISLAFFCDGTLAELQHCFRDAVDLYSTTSSQTRLHAFRTVDEVQSIIATMDLERAVITVETEIDWYDGLYSLLRSIKSIGAGTVTGGPANGLGWRGILQEAARLYQGRYGQDGRIPATYKVLYLSAQTKLK